MPQIGHDNGVVVVLAAGRFEQPSFDFGNAALLVRTDMELATFASFREQASIVLFQTNATVGSSIDFSFKASLILRSHVASRNTSTTAAIAPCPKRAECLPIRWHLGFANARGIDEPKLDAFHDAGVFHRIRCRSRGGTDDRTLVAKQGIEQRWISRDWERPIWQPELLLEWHCHAERIGKPTDSFAAIRRAAHRTFRGPRTPHLLPQSPIRVRGARQNQ